MNWTPWFSQRLKILIYFSCLGCLAVPPQERKNLPPNVAARLCPADSAVVETTEYRTPTRRLSDGEVPDLQDDLTLAGLDEVIKRQLDRFDQIRLTGFIWFGGDRFPLKAVRDSLRTFRNLLREAHFCMGTKEEINCLSEFERKVKAKFAFYIPDLTTEDPRYGEPQPIFFTGYYTPLIRVSPFPTSTYKYPIFQKPADPWFSRTGRYEIDFRGGLAGQGLELFYASNLFDLYLLHLEGGGRLVWQDERGHEQTTYISYAGSNGRKWRFIVAKMLEKKWVTEPSVTYQREFVDSNPELHPEIFSYCPSYVFFKLSRQPPEGSDRVPLTDNRSIATDNNFYRFKGALAFVRTERPRTLGKEVEMMPFSRFVLDQDTGSAIRGKGRVDFYLGEGLYAELAANTMKQRGDLFFLMLKP